MHVQAATGTGDWIQHKGIKKPAGASKKVSKISGAESGAFEVQNAVQHQAAPTCTFSQFATQPLAPYDVVRGLATVCKTLQSETMGEEGFELVKETTGNSEVFKTGGAECGADAAGWHIPSAQDDPDLKKLIEGWSALPLEIRSGIMLIASSYKSS